MNEKIKQYMKYIIYLLCVLFFYPKLLIVIGSLAIILCSFLLNFIHIPDFCFDFVTEAFIIVFNGIFLILVFYPLASILKIFDVLKGKTIKNQILFLTGFLFTIILFESVIYHNSGDLKDILLYNTVFVVIWLINYLKFKYNLNCV